MSTYEDIGLSYVDFDTTSKYGTITLANPIGTTESFFLAVKFRSFNGAVNTRIISVGASTTTVISAYCHSTTTIYLKRVCASGEDVSTANGFGASYGNDGEDHIAVLYITPTQQKIYLDSLSNVGSDSSLVGSLTEALTKITINSRVTSTTPDQIGKSRIYWAALYSALPDADITSLMSGAAPNTVGTLRSGDSFWAFDGNANEYNGGTPFTMVGSPTFVQPAYNDTLAVVDSYLSLDSTQYAQAPIGATRIATFGDGTDVYATIPTWTATNWEIEFDVVFTTTLTSAIRYLIDTDSGGLNRQNIYTTTDGVINRSSGGYTGYLDGAAITFGTTVHPVDGAVHHIKLVSDSALLVNVGRILSRYSSVYFGNSAIFNLRLTDLSNSANSRFYPMDEVYRTNQGNDIFYSQAALGSNVIANWYTAYVNNGTTSTWNGEKLTVVAVDGQSDHIHIPVSGLTIGKQYLYEIECNKVGNTPHAAIDGATWGEEGWNGITWTTKNTLAKLVTATATSGLCRIYPAQSTVSGGAAGDTLEIYRVSIKEANEAGQWYNRVSGDVRTVYPDAIKPGEEFYFAIKYKVTDVSQNSGYNNHFSIGRKASGAYSSICLYLPESNGKFYVDPYNGTARTTGSGITGKDMGDTHLDGLTHIAVVRLKTDGSYEFWNDADTPKYTGVPNSQLAYAMDVINLNGIANATTGSSARMGIKFYYVYLYNTLSPADINALMQGEHPASVGNVRQGYNLLGDGSEVNGGPALTLYPTLTPPNFVVPRRNGLTFPLVSSLIRSLASSLVSR